MKRLHFFLYLLLLASSFSGHSQNLYAELFGGHDRLQHEVLIARSLDSAARFDYFGIANFSVDYQDRTLADPFIYSVATFNLTRWFGIAAGGYINRQAFVPIAAVSFQYFNKKGDLYLNVFPTIELTSRPNYEMFGLLMYNPAITDRLRFFSQVTFSSNFNFTRHNASFQQARIGLDIHGLQVGAGWDTQFVTELVTGKLQTRAIPNAGLFVRKSFY